MAPPLPLANVASTLALSFTTGRAAPASEPPPVQQPTSVPTPPRLPPVPGETEADATAPAPGPSETTTKTATGPSTTEADTTPATGPSETEGATPVAPFEPGPDDAPYGPAELEDPLAEDERRPVPPPRLMRPNQRKFMFGLFVGGSKALRGYSFYGGSEFKAEASIGGHDQRFRKGGFAVVQVNKGFPFTSFTLAPRLSLNRQIIPDYAFYFTTNLSLGYRLSTYSYGDYYGGYDGYGYDYDSGGRYLMHSAVLGVSWGASAIIAERLLLSFRPLDLELVVPAPSIVQINWSVMGGLGVLWGRTTSEKTRAARPTSRRRGG
jgi:hypothetical protein